MENYNWLETQLSRPSNIIQVQKKKISAEPGECNKSAVLTYLLVSSFREHKALLDRVFALTFCLLFVKLKATPLMVRVVGWLHESTTKIKSTSKPPPSVNGNDNFGVPMGDVLALPKMKFKLKTCRGIRPPDILPHACGFQTGWSQRTMVPQ